MKKNAQPPIPVSTDAELSYTEIFRTVQGEGPLVGSPSVFVRLAGCNLQCPGCDTLYPEQGRMKPRDIAVAAMRARQGFQCPVMVITGGEPMRQAAVGELVKWAVSMGFVVQIETNGTLWQAMPEDAAPLVVVSPKLAQVADGLREFSGMVNWKYPLHHRHVDPDDGLPTLSLANRLGEGERVARPPRGAPAVWVQPMDTGKPATNKKNLEAAIDSAQRHGYRLGVQLHKMIGLP